MSKEISDEVKKSVEISQILQSSKDCKQAYDILENVVIGFFLINTKPGCTLPAFKKFCESVKNKLISSEEDGFKNMVDKALNMSVDEFKQFLSKHEKSDINTDIDNLNTFDFRNN